MANYNIGGISLLNRVKTIEEALLKSHGGDELFWNKTNKINSTLIINEGIRLVGNRSKITINEHKVGISINGSGDLVIEDLVIHTNQLANAFLIDWVGTITFKNCDIIYKQKVKSEKAYPTISTNGDPTDLDLIFENCIIDGANVEARNIDISTSLFNGNKCVNIVKAENLNIKNTTVNNFTTWSNTTIIENSNIDDEFISDNETCVIKNSDFGVNKTSKLDFKTNLSVDNCNFTNIDEIIFNTCKVSLKNVHFNKFKINAVDSEIEINENVSDNADWNTENTIFSNRTETTIANVNKALSAKEELDKLVGLKNVKDKMASYISMARIINAREKQGLNTMDYSLHLVYSGSPGTGKTTVAEIFAKALYEEGLLPTSNVLITGRADFIGQHVGESEALTKEIIQRAKGGVLFIDEAYSLLPNFANDFAKEVIDILVEELDKNRKDLVVIMAGYSDPMKNFFNKANPGLKSRFTNWVEFKDYSLEELIEIMSKNILSQYPKTNEDTILKATTYLSSLYNNGKVDGNARFVRNFVQAIAFSQSSRLMNEVDLTKNLLETIEVQDIDNAYIDFSKQLTERNS